MRIRTVWTYPVKGCRRVEHEAAPVDAWGLRGDRRWMLVDPDGVGITQREMPVLTQLRARVVDGGIELSAPGLPPVRVSEPHDGPEEVVRVFRSKGSLPARIAEKEWSSAFLGRDARLVWQADPTGRTIETHAEAGDRVSLADGFPVLLASESSLAAINDWLAESGDEPVPMTRFRPNLVVAGAPPWAEDDWLGGRLRIGDTMWRAAQSCSRCVVTTIDQETGQRTGQPLRMLGRHRRFEGKLLFAINLIPDAPDGVVRVGDPVEVALSDS